MHVLLQITSGPATGRRFRLRQGQVARIGRTAWADFSVPDDAEMADVHFEIACDAYRCTIRRVDTACETLRNGAPVEESRIRTGDSITAGGTTFGVTLDGAPAFDPRGGDDDAPDVDSSVDDQPVAEEVCAGITLSEAGQQRMAGGIKAGPYFDLLTGEHLWEDAARFLAAWLSRPQSVAWGCACLEQTAGDRLSAAQRAGLEAAAVWGTEPTEEHRRLAQQAAEALGGRTPAGWLALAAFWSTGSIGPPDAPEIPAAAGMSARAVGTAVVTIAAQAAGRQSPASVLRGFVEEGHKRMEQGQP